MTELVRYRMLIDGAWVDAGDGGTFESMNPATGEPWAIIPEATAADVDRTVQAAHRAFTEGPWSRTTPTERGRYLRRLADLLADRSEQLGRTETVDTGKMLKETRWQAKYIADFFRFYAGCADKVHGETLPIDSRRSQCEVAVDRSGVVIGATPEFSTFNGWTRPRDGMNRRRMAAPGEANWSRRRRRFGCDREMTPIGAGWDGQRRDGHRRDWHRAREQRPGRENPRWVTHAPTKVPLAWRGLPGREKSAAPWRPAPPDRKLRERTRIRNIGEIRTGATRVHRRNPAEHILAMKPESATETHRGDIELDAPHGPDTSADGRHHYGNRRQGDVVCGNCCMAASNV